MSNIESEGDWNISPSLKKKNKVKSGNKAGQQRLNQTSNNKKKKGFNKNNNSPHNPNSNKNKNNTIKNNQNINNNQKRNPSLPNNNNISNQPPQNTSGIKQPTWASSLFGTQTTHESNVVKASLPPSIAQQKEETTQKVSSKQTLDEAWDDLMTQDINTLDWNGDALIQQPPSIHINKSYTTSQITTTTNTNNADISWADLQEDKADLFNDPIAEAEIEVSMSDTEDNSSDAQYARYELERSRGSCPADEDESLWLERRRNAKICDLCYRSYGGTGEIQWCTSCVRIAPGHEDNVKSQPGTEMLNKGVKAKDVTMVLFHGSCPDGMAASWAAWKLLGRRARYHSVYHDRPFPDVSGQVVAVLDFYYEGKQLASMLEQCKALITIDHHKGAHEALAHIPNSHKVIDLEQSGATLAWNFFHPNAGVPIFLRYIEDVDMFRNNMKKQKKLTCMSI